MQDFSNQKLRGKSFREQGLSDANFTRADLRGADFQQANLTNANFTQAQFGLTPLNRGLQLLTTTIATTLSATFTYALSPLLTTLQATEPHSLPLLLGGITFLGRITLHLGVDALNQWLMRILVILVILVSMILGGYPDWGNALTLVALSIAAAAGLTQAIALIAQCGELLAGPIASSALMGLAVAASAMAIDNPIAGSIALSAIVLGGYLGLYRNDPMVRSIAVALTTVGGTQLQKANLKNADFTKAQLGSTDMRQAILTQARFYQAERLDQARVGRSILQEAAVLRLLVTLDGRDRSFAEMDLTGANLREADLTGANLLRVNAIEADFTQANFTGACVADWNIDASTQLAGVDCQYVYLMPGLRDRLPAHGEWKAGEFTRHFTISEQDQGSIFDVEMPKNEAINPQEILASLMVLVRLAIADHNLEAAEKQMLTEAIKALELPAEITLERLLDDRTRLDILLKKINSPIIRERVYQSAYLMARMDGELEPEEEAILTRIQIQLQLSESTLEKLQFAVTEAQNLSIASQIEAIIDPETRAAAVKTNIRLMALMHAFSGAMPIPGFAIVTHLMIYKDQVELVQKIGRIWGYADDHKAPELNQVLFGSVGATAARVAISNVMLLIPVWGSVVGASTAFSMTWAIGELAQKFFAGEVDAATLTEEFANAKALGQKIFQDSQDAIEIKQKEIAKLIQELQLGLQSGSLTQQDYMQLFRDRIGQSLND